MPVTYVIAFDVQPGKVPVFRQMLDGVLDAMRAEANFHQAVLHRDPGSDTRFLLYETWEDHEDVLAVQLARPYRLAWHEALPDLLARPRDISMWQPLRDDRRGQPAAAAPPAMALAAEPMLKVPRPTA